MASSCTAFILEIHTSLLSLTDCITTHHDITTRQEQLVDSTTFFRPTTRELLRVERREMTPSDKCRKQKSEQKNNDCQIGREFGRNRVFSCTSWRQMFLTLVFVGKVCHQISPRIRVFVYLCTGSTPDSYRRVNHACLHQVDRGTCCECIFCLSIHDGSACFEACGPPFLHES